MSNDQHTDLIQRLESLPAVGGSDGPDTAAMRSRASQRRGRKRVAGSVVAVAAVIGGTLGAITTFGGSSPEVVNAAGVTETTITSEGSDIDEADDAAAFDGEQATTTTSPPPEEGGLNSESTPLTTAPPLPDDVEGDEQVPTTAAPPIAIGPGEVSDQLGGKLVVGEDEILHLSADGTVRSIVASRFEGSRQTQIWLHDIAPIDGVPHLIFNTFTAFDIEQQIFETTIELVNLETDELTVVERRRIEGTDNDNWIYNDHVTTDGTNLLVARELWQGQCYFTETLTVVGEVLDFDEQFPKPQWLDGIDPAVAEEWQTNWDLIPDDDCVDLNEWNDLGRGRAVLGATVSADELTELASAVN